MNGIRSLKQSGLSSNVTISMTLMRTNITSAPEMLRFVRDMGIPKIRFLPLHSQGRAKSHWADLDAPRKAYLEWYRYVYYAPEARSASTEISGGLPGFLLTTSGVGAERWCSVGRSVVIDSTGEVYPCPLLMDRRFSLGNIGESSLLEIRDSKRLKGLVAACLERMEYVDKCRRCAWKGMCQAACPAHVFLKSGTLWGTDEFCEFRQCLYADRIFEVAKAKANN
jgi:radical SAM protein with 4Fe4S-binding SPASM domain